MIQRQSDIFHTQGKRINIHQPAARFVSKTDYDVIVELLCTHHIIVPVAFEPRLQDAQLFIRQLNSS